MTRTGSRGRWLARAEAVCWVLAVALALPYLGTVTAREAVTYAAMQTDWSESRRAAYQRLLREADLSEPLGVLRLPDSDRAIPVYAGTGEAALTLGAGHLPETAGLDGRGNIALAGHRDGFFRALRHLRPGDRLVLETSSGERAFRVTAARVVAPEDVWVLDPTAETRLTLITCHPFYFVGSAPDRYVVQARLEPAAGAVVAAPAG